MPHCNLGQELHEGDIVIIRCRVKSVQAQDNYCNVTLETLHPMPPYESLSAIVLNTKQVELVEKAK